MVSLFLQELWICTSEFNKPKVLALYLIIESLNQIHEIAHLSSLHEMSDTILAPKKVFDITKHSF